MGGEILDIQPDQAFTISVNQTAQFSDKELTLTLQEVLEDSRCPSNVNCPEAGQARISIRISQIGQAPATLEMNTNPPLKLDVVNYNGFQIRLLTLNPYPEDIETPTSTPTSSSVICPDVMPSQLSVGMKAITAGDLNLRSSPGRVAGNIIRINRKGIEFEIISGPVCNPVFEVPHIWWEVKMLDGLTGWVVEASETSYFLEAVE